MSYPDPPLTYTVAKTKTIFLGKVVKKYVWFKYEDGDKYRIQSIKLKVEKEFKGVDNELQEVILFDQVTNRTSCSFESRKMDVGEKWIIFKDYSEGGKYQSNLRGPDSELYSKYSAKDDKDYLANIEQIVKNPTTSIHIELQTPLGLSYIKDAEINIESNGIKRTAICAPKIRWSMFPGGIYSFENIPPGKYKVQVRLPYNAIDYTDKKNSAIFDEKNQIFYFEYDIEVKPNDTEYFLRVLEKQKENKIDK